jgi:bacterioferritin (cytochrome b1)
MSSSNTSGVGRISDLGYDIITLLQSKLEAVDVYDQFIEDAREAGDQQSAQLFEQIKQQDEQQVEQLSAALERIVKAGKLR